MRLFDVRLSVLALAVSVGVPAVAQQLISAKSGLIHYVEGDVRIGTQAAGPSNGVFQSLANGKDLQTGEGRAEILLGPGQFVRLNDNSSLRMVSNKLEATRVDLLSGSILVELVEIEKNAPITIGFAANTIELRKAGLYRLDTTEYRLRVIEGEAVVHGTGQTLTAKKSKEVSMGAVLAENGFDANVGDEFGRWASRRAGYIATANISGARDIYANGQDWSANNWAFNPWYGMYTYVPSRRMLFSPFGFGYFTPDMAFNGMFWPYLAGGYGFYGMGFGYGYGYPAYGYGSGYGYGYGSGYGGYSGGGSNYSGGGSKGGTPNRNGYPISRPTAFGPRGVGVTSPYNPGNYSAPSMVRGGGANHPSVGGNAPSSGGGYHASGGSYTGGGSSHSGGVAYSGGGGHSSSGGSVSSSGSSGTTSAPAGGGASSAGASAGGRSK